MSGCELDSERILVGRVRRPHGVRGEVVIEPLSDVPDRFESGREVTIVAGGREALAARIVACRPYRGALLVRFAGLEDRDAVEPLRGADVEVPRRQSPRPPRGAYYYYELMDLECRDRREGRLGRVVEIIEDGGGLLLRIEETGRELLIPFVEAYLRRVDLDGGRIDFDLPEGLIQACASTS